MKEANDNVRARAIRHKITGWLHQCKYLMDRKMITPSLRKYEAIEILDQRLRFLVTQPLDQHYEWLVKLRNYLIDILPASGGRFNGLRVQLIQLLDEAEKKVNNDAKQRLLVKLKDCSGWLDQFLFQVETPQASILLTLKVLVQTAPGETLKY